MARITIEKGILKGLDLEPWEPRKFIEISASYQTVIERASFYGNTLQARGLVLRGLRFNECSFAKSTFEGVLFRRCTFSKVDLTRTTFERCEFSECRFLDCDPYYADFKDSFANPSDFKRCYRSDHDWNKGLILFSNLKKNFENLGNHRAVLAADYYYRVWERKGWFAKWWLRETSGKWPWLKSLVAGALTGYGERPQYVAGWMLLLVTCAAFIYKYLFPASVSMGKPSFLGYWYFSFRVLFARGLSTENALTSGLALMEVLEFSAGLVLVALLLASVTRRLS